MKIEQLLKKHKIIRKDFREYAGFTTRSGFNAALKNKKRRIRIRHSLTCYVLEHRANINIRKLLEIIDDDE